MSSQAQRNGEKSIRAKKIARIWCLARDIGWDKETVYLVVESVTGKDSISKLSDGQLSGVVFRMNEELLKLKRRQKNTRRKEQKNGVAYLPSPEQRALVQELMAKLKTVLRLRDPVAYLEAVCKRTFRREYKKLTRYQMQSLIEALKSIYERSIDGDRGLK